MKLKNSALILLTLLSALSGRAEDFDLDYLPKEKAETTAVTQEMLAVGEEFAYRTEDAAQKLWIFRPEGLKGDELRPCVFFIHGGGWGGSPNTLAPQCIYLARRGVVAVSIHFRRPAPKAGVSPKDCLADCLSAYRWVKQNGKKHNIDPDRIVVSGGSAGGHLSLAMITIPGCDHPDDDLDIPIDPKALILFNPAMDLVEGWKNGAKKCRAAKIDPAIFSPAHFVKPGLPETLILSGGKDTLISPTMIRQFMERMDNHGNKSSFVEYPDAGHGFFNYGRESNVYFQQTMAEAEKFLMKLGYIESQNHGEDGWVSLFDGKTTAGWVQMNGTITYAVEDGAIVGTSLTGKSPMSFLCTDKQYTDFELEFDVNIFDRALNSGVQIRSLPKEKKRADAEYGPIAGPQVEISAGKKPGKTRSGFIYGQGWKGWLTAKEDLINHDLYKFGEWNHFRVIAKGDKVTTFLNGTQVTETTIPAERHETHSKGHIGLQVHAVKDALSPYRVAWKNIRIREF